jgi:hypothetical protein
MWLHERNYDSHPLLAVSYENAPHGAFLFNRSLQISYPTHPPAHRKLCCALESRQEQTCKNNHIPGEMDEPVPNLPTFSAMDLASIGLESADDLIRDEPDAAGAHLQGAGRATGLSGDEKNYRVTATGPASPNLSVLALQEFPYFLASAEIFVIKLSNIAASAAFAWCCIIKFLHPFQHCACIVAFFSSAWF